MAVGDSEHADAVYHAASTLLYGVAGLAAVELRTHYNVLRGRAGADHRAQNRGSECNDVSYEGTLDCVIVGFVAAFFIREAAACLWMHFDMC